MHFVMAQLYCDENGVCSTPASLREIVVTILVCLALFVGWKQVEAGEINLDKVFAWVGISLLIAVVWFNPLLAVQVFVALALWRFWKWRKIKKDTDPGK
jgi:hypothetical protein